MRRTRRMESKTDYKARMSMLKSEKARIVIRKTNRYIILQLVESKESKDFVLFGLNSKELLKSGWPEKLQGSLKSLSAAYAVGFVFGKNILKIKEAKGAISDLGLYRPVGKSRIYAAIKGIIDAGFEVKCDEKMLPEEKRIMTGELSQIINKIKGEK